MSEIQIAINDDIGELLGNTPDEIERHAREMIVLELYRRRELSSGRAAELLGLDRFAFIRWSGALGISYLDMTPEEWQEERRLIRQT